MVAAILVIASLRGLFLGLVRQAFSLAGIAGAYIAVRVFARPLGDWLLEVSSGGIAPGLAPWLAGAVLIVLTIGFVTGIGRIARRGVRAVGLGGIDRLGGALLGAAEGAVIVALLLVMGGRSFGWDHPAIANTRTLEALEQMQLLASQDPPAEPDVASPPRSL